MSAPKITLIGAGGLSFGPTMVNDVIHTPALAGSRLVLHDVNEQRLLRAYRFAAKLNAANGAPVILDYSTDPGTALARRRLLPEQRRVRSLHATGTRTTRSRCATARRR